VLGKYLCTDMRKKSLEVQVPEIMGFPGMQVESPEVPEILSPSAEAHTEELILLCSQPEEKTGWSGTRSHSRSSKKSRSHSTRSTQDLGPIPAEHCTGSEEDKEYFLNLHSGARLGSAALMQELGSLYETGLKGVCKDLEEASKWFSLSASEDPQFSYDVGRLAYTGNGGRIPPDFAEALYHFKRAAAVKEARACFYVGLMSYLGEGLDEKDPAQAFNFSRTAAKAGNPNAMNNLSLFYLMGFGCCVDLSRAVKWIERASKANTFCGVLNHAMFLAKGIGMRTNKSEADKKLVKCEKQMYLSRDRIDELFKDQKLLLDRGALSHLQVEVKF